MSRKDVLKEDKRPPPADARPTAGAAGVPDGQDPNPEVEARPIRRRFTAKYKRAILREADKCDKGEVGALLRREGLYSSHLASWRRQRERGELQGLKPRKRGPKSKRDPAGDEIKRLRRHNARLERELEKARTVIEFQKKLSELLGIPLNAPPNDEIDS